MSDKIYSAIPRTAEEIIGKNIISFIGEDWRGAYAYSIEMNDMALKGRRIKLKKRHILSYDYEGVDNIFLWRKEWLKDIREESNE